MGLGTQKNNKGNTMIPWNALRHKGLNMFLVLCMCVATEEPPRWVLLYLGRVILDVVEYSVVGHQVVV